MLRPELDLEDRSVVWDSLQWLYQDTDPAEHHDEMIRACGSSKYTLAELEEILFNEILPSLRFNLNEIAGDWQGYELNWLVKRILEKNRFEKRRPFFWRRYTQEHWEILKPGIEAFRVEHTQGTTEQNDATDE